MLELCTPSLLRFFFLVVPVILGIARYNPPRDKSPETVKTDRPFLIRTIGVLCWSPLPRSPPLLSSDQGGNTGKDKRT